MRQPSTIRTALLAGFCVIFAIWLGSAYYFTTRLDEFGNRSSATRARFVRGQELLFAVRSQVLLGSLYLRDALIDASDTTIAPADAQRQLRQLQKEVDRDLAEYKEIDSVVDGPSWARLDAELTNYWDAAARLVRVDERSPDGAGGAAARLRREVIPRRDVIVGLSNDIQQMMADGYRRDEEQLRRAYELIRRRFWVTTAVAVALGVAIAIGSTGFAGRLEATARERYAEVLRNRQELRRLSGRIVSAQEEERRAIARELHDEIGQALTAVDCQLSLAQRHLGSAEQPAAALTDARTVTEQALRSVRDLSQLLRPSMLDDFGLPDTLKWSLERFSARTGIRTRLIEDGLSERLPSDVELCVYRTVQEALTNVARHAHATSCQVYVQRLASSLLVTVEDDGVGLQAVRDETERQRDGVGLLGIRERVASLGGSFQIDGSSRAGTRLTIELPLASGA